MSSDTPRTDQRALATSTHGDVVSSFFCRQLERELNAAREQIEQRAKMMREIMSERDKAEEDLALAREELQKERARFDWLETQDVWIGVYGEYDLRARIYAGGGYSQGVRDAIDAAMKEDAK